MLKMLEERLNMLTRGRKTKKEPDQTSKCIQMCKLHA